MARKTDPSQLPYGLLWPRLTRFYGLTPDDLAGMPRWQIRQYVEDMTVLQAQEQIFACQAAVFPHLSASDSSETQRGLRDLAGMNEPAVKVNVDDDRNALASLGIRVAVGNDA